MGVTGRSLQRRAGKVAHKGLERERGNKAWKLQSL